MNEKYAMELATAFLGSLGFAMLFHVRREKLLLASLGGLLAWGVYLLAGIWWTEDVVRYFASAVTPTIYGETLARVVKCPATLFIITASIPLIPGGSLYHTMKFFMEGKFDAFSQQGLHTVLLAVAIAVGILIPTSVFRLVQQARRQRAASRKSV